MGKFQQDTFEDQGVPAAVGNLRDSIDSASAKEQSPLADALMHQEKGISELDMKLEVLEKRLSPISSPRNDEKEPGEREVDSNSQVVNAFNDQTHRIRKLSQRVERLIKNLEV